MSWYEYLTDLIIKFTDANEKFVTGDLVAKKELLLAICQNSVVLDGKLRITPNEWLIPLRAKTVYFRQQIEQVRTLPQQIRMSLLDALRLEWLAILDQVRTCYILSNAPYQGTEPYESFYYREDQSAA
jgi:hypothetical protein